MKKTVKTFLLPLLVPMLFLAAWELCALRLGNEIILPPVERAGIPLLHPLKNLISMGSLLDNIAISLARVLSGYILAAITAIPLGIVMGYSIYAAKLLTGFLGLFRPIPPLAWVPLVLAWFGVASLATLVNLPIGPFYGYLHNIKLSMLFIIFIGAFYPILTSAMHGVRMVPDTLLDAARVLGANEREIFRKVLLPATAPAIVNGLRIGLGVAWMCLVSAEMLPGSISGVGYLITHAYTVGRTDVVVAGMVSIGALGSGLDWLFRLFEENKFAWKRLTR
jgi:NitT/TauT family transport system permease protein